jgi:ribulose-phosphate 3-epimerase
MRSVAMPPPTRFTWNDDGHFVPNLSMGPVVVEALRRVTRLPLDVHLMITDPSKHVDSFIKAGASHVSFHVEAEDDPPGLAARLHERGITAGLALNPETPVDRVLDLLPHFCGLIPQVNQLTPA